MYAKAVQLAYHPLTLNSADRVRKNLPDVSSLKLTDVHGRVEKISAWLHSTLEWFLQAPSWQSWFSAPTSQMLLVTGHAGCGKSTLALYVMHALARTSPAGFTTCRYFFDGTVANQCDPCALLRALIHQIVSSHRKLLRIVRKAADLQGPQFYHNFPALRTIFTTLIAHKRLRGMALLIYAIDECEETVQVEIVRWLSAVIRNTTSSLIKIFLTSRPGSRAVSELDQSAEEFLRFRFEDESKLVGDDVERLIQERVLGLQRAGLCVPAVANNLQQLLKDRSDGTFLWVSLAMSHLGGKRLIRINDVRKIAALLPQDLMKLYESIIEGIPDEERELVSRALRMLMACERHLNISELNVLVCLDADSRSTSEAREHSYLDNAQTVESLLGALVKIVDFRVMLVHHTLKEYLMNNLSTSQGQVAKLPKHDDYSRDFSIAETCMRYLLLQDLADIRLDGTYSDTGSSLDSPVKQPVHHQEDPADAADLHLDGLFETSGQITNDSMNLISARYELYDYAARFWALHFQRCQPSEIVSLEVLALRLYQGSPSFGWFDYHIAVDGKPEFYPSQPNMLTFSCYLGHSYITRKLVLEQSHRSALGSACFWAAAMGHEPCLRILLQHGGGDLSNFSFQAQSALSIASRNGHLGAVECLLASGQFDVNFRAAQCRTSLSLAAGAGHENIVVRLLEEQDIDIDSPDSAGAPPIFWAVSAESPPILGRIMNDGRSHSDLLDLSHRNALSWACEYGFVECVELLLSDGVSSTAQDSKGRTSLIYAVIFENLEVVKQLVKRDKASIGLKDHSGRNAVSWAAQCRNPKIMAYLLRHDPHGAIVEDQNGWVPIAWTMDPPERPQNAILLMPYLSRDLKGNAWVFLFALALRWGSLSVAWLLLENEAFDVNSMDSSGRTALGHAAAAGNVKLVRTILTRPDVMKLHADFNDDTAYSLAASHHHQEVCDLLRTSGCESAQLGIE